MSRKPTTLDLVLQLLADGVPRTAKQIGEEISEAHGFSPASVAVACTYLGDDRRVVRVREGRSFVYRLAERVA